MNFVNLTIIFLIIRLIKIFIVVDYCNIFFKTVSDKARWIMCIIVYILALLTDIIFDSLYISIIESFIVIYLIMQVYEGDICYKILFSAMNVALECVADFITSFIIYGSITVSDTQINDSNMADKFISVLLFYFFVILVKNIYRVRDYGMIYDMSYNWLYFMLLALVSIGVWYIIAKGLISTQEGMVCVGASLLVMNMVSYKLYESVADAYRYEKENEKLKEQMDIYECQISTNIENDRVVRSLRHDMKLHLEEIQMLAAGKRYDELESYISDMTDAAKPLYNMTGTGNPAVDGILDYMCSKAQDSGVTVKRKLRIPEDVTLSAYDMNIILGNLMENAIENTLKTDNPYIELILKYQSGTIYMKVTNTCINDQKIKDGKYLTTKTDDEAVIQPLKAAGHKRNVPNKKNGGSEMRAQHNGRKHGFGLMNVRSCVDKYSGTMKLTCEDGKFVAEVLIYVPV